MCYLPRDDSPNDQEQGFGSGVTILGCIIAIAVEFLATMDSDKLYSSISRFYDLSLFFAGYTVAIDYFIRQIPLSCSKAIKALDAGCGTGLYSLGVLKRFPDAQITAFDLNSDMVKVFISKLAKREALANRVKVFIADISEPFPSIEEGFDLIITGGVLEYVNIEEAVKNLSRYLALDAYFLNVSIKDNMAGKLIGKIYNLRLYCRDTIIQAFTKNGFALIKTYTFPLAKEAYLFKKVVEL
jgi:SAM-dependent methyltransferase